MVRGASSERRCDDPRPRPVQRHRRLFIGAWNERAASGPWRSARSNRFAGACWRSIGRRCLVTMTYGYSPLNIWPLMVLQSTRFVEVSRARTSAWRETVRDYTVSSRGYGLNTRALLANYDRDTSSWRTSQHSLFGGLSAFSEPWPRSGTMRNGIAYQLHGLVPLTKGIASGLLPTPRKSEVRNGKNIQGGLGLTSTLALLDPDISSIAKVNPRWLEWFMGFPIKWTEFPPSETPWFRKSPS